MEKEINKDYKNFKNQKEWEKYIKYILKTDDKALFRAVIIVYNNQTETEKLNKMTSEHNKMGFNSLDSKILTEYALKIKKDIYISFSEIEYIRKLMIKYWRQIMIYSKYKLKKEKEINKVIEKNKERVKNEPLQKKGIESNIKPLIDPQINFFYLLDK